MTAARCLGAWVSPQNEVIVPDPHPCLTLWDVWRPDGCGGEQRIIEVGFFPNPAML